MRISTFIVGGLVGAAATIYLSRKNNHDIFSNVGQAGKSVQRMFKKFDLNKGSKFSRQMTEMLDSEGNEKATRAH